MYLSDAIIEFLEYMEIEQNRSQKTIQNYHHYLMRLVEFIDDKKVEKLDAEDIRKWRIWLNRYADGDGQTLSKSTQSYHLIALRSMLKFLTRRGFDVLPSDRIELPRTTRKEVAFLDSNEMQRLLATPNIDEQAGLRDRAILELLYSSGLRVSELINLNRNHINLVRREFSVRGKGNKDRLVFVSDEAAQWIERYLKSRTDNYQPLFINYSIKHEELDEGEETRLTARSVQRFVQRYSGLAGITKKVTPHTLRHSFATDLLSNGADIRSVQSLLGHSNISTTQIYTHITDPKLREVHKKFHRKT